MNQFNIPGTKEAIAEIEALSVKTNELAANLLQAAMDAEKMMKSFGGTESLKAYIELQKKASQENKKIGDSAEKLLQSEQKLAEAQVKAKEKIRLAEIKLQQDREKAFDKHQANLDKQIAKEEKTAQEAIKASEKIIAQKEKEFAQFEKDFNKYEADIAKKALAEERAALKSIQNAEKQRLSDLRLQKQREVAIDKYTMDEEKAAAAAARTAAQVIYNSRAYVILNRERTAAAQKLRDLIASETASNVEIRKAQREFDVLAAKVKKADLAVNDFTKNVGNYPQMFNNIGSGLKNLIGAFGITGGVAAFAGIMKGAYDTSKKFEQGIADLSAITGASGKDLEYLKDKAIDLGKGVQGGAVAVVEAYKLIASAKPELLDNVKALNSVTQAAITLSQAAGMELPAAATALTDAMNQFGAPAERAAEFVDALANGAKYGSAEIPQTTEALLKFGAVAKSTNVSIAESVALIQVLADKGIKGAEAGTALRNVLLKISAPDALPKRAKEAIDALGISMSTLRDKTVPIQEKLELLKPLLNDNAKMVQIFGLENVVAAQNVIGHTDRLAELTVKMGEVGSAEEQAAIRMDTVTGKTEKLSSTYDSLILSISKGSGPISNFWKGMLDGATAAIEGLIRFNTSWDDLYKKAKEKGQEVGGKSFQGQFNNLRGTGTDAEIAASIKETADRQFKMYEKQYAENEKKLKEVSERNANVSFANPLKAIKYYNSGQDELQKEKERLTQLLNERAEIIRKAQDTIKPKQIAANTDAETTSTLPGVPTDADLKKAEAALRKLEAAQRKSAEEAIKVMKLTLDYQMAMFDQAAANEEENIAHIKAISSLKLMIADAELQKNLIGIKKNSEDYANILAAGAKDVEKIKLEEAIALKKVINDHAKYELEFYDRNNKSLIDGNENLSDLLIANEKKRLRAILEIERDKKREILGIEEELTDAKLEEMARTADGYAQLSQNEREYYKFLQDLNKKTNDAIKKNDDDLLKAKLANIDKLIDTEARKRKLDAKTENEKSEIDMEAEKERYTRKTEELENNLNNNVTTRKDYEDTVAAMEEVDLDYKEKVKIFDEAKLNSKKESLELGLDSLKKIAGEETAIGKAAAVAQILINSYQGASKEFAKGGILGIATGALVIAAGAVQVANVLGVDTSFFKGTLDAPYSGKATVDELGPELHFDKFWNLKSSGQAGGARTTNISMGDKIIPADISSAIKKTMFRNSIGKGDSTPFDFSRMEEIYARHTDKIVNSINNKKDPSFQFIQMPNTKDKNIFKGKNT